MENERRNGLSEGLETGRAAAHLIRGAMKTGKAVSGAAKGAAAGPYGAAVGALWTNRKLLGKVLAAVAVLLLLPVLIILMLPSLIFGSLQSAFSIPEEPPCCGRG